MNLSTSKLLGTLLTAGLLTSSLVGCGDTEDTDEPAPAGDATYTVRFAAMVGAEPFVCGQTYTGLGTADGSASFMDLRFYVSDVRLVNAAGEEVALELPDDGTWQSSGVALLDFEDACGNGNTAMNSEVTGTAPAGTYTGVRFTLGIPLGMNDPNVGQELRPSPLNVSSMYWSWSTGYKFLRIDAQETFKFHLGATGCTEAGDPFSCANANQPQIALDGWSEDKAVVFDMAALLQDVPLGTADEPVCHSQPDNAQCAELFSALGLPHGGAAAGTPRAFRLE